MSKMINYNVKLASEDIEALEDRAKLEGQPPRRLARVAIRYYLATANFKLEAMPQNEADRSHTP